MNVESTVESTVLSYDCSNIFLNLTEDNKSFTNIKDNKQKSNDTLKQINTCISFLKSKRSADDFNKSNISELNKTNANNYIRNLNIIKGSDNYDEEALSFIKEIEFLPKEAIQLEFFSNDNINICPKCNSFVYLGKNYLRCYNRDQKACFIIESHNFNEGFTVNNFLDLYLRFLKLEEHFYCSKRVILIEFSGAFEIFCEDCFVNNFE